VDRFILSLMDGSTAATVGEIARQVQERFSGLFPGERQALTRVGELSRRCSR